MFKKVPFVPVYVVVFGSLLGCASTWDGLKKDVGAGMSAIGDRADGRACAQTNSGEVCWDSALTCSTDNETRTVQPKGGVTVSLATNQNYCPAEGVAQ